MLRDGEPFLAIGTPGGDNQEQTILQALLNVIEFRQVVSEPAHGVQLPRLQTFTSRLVLAAPCRIQQLNVESDFPDAVIEELKSRGHDVKQDRATQHPELRDRGDDRSGNGDADRGGGSPAGLLRDGILTTDLVR